MKPGTQVQVGEWLITWQMASCPQVPGQGFWHLFLIQARFERQSELTVHSGRHPSYGLPMYSGKQAQDPTPFCSLQMAFEPQGDGVQGEVGIAIR